MLCGILATPLASFEAVTVTVDNLTYYISQDEAALTGSTEGTSVTDIIIPATITFDGTEYPVTVIGVSA